MLFTSGQRRDGFSFLSIDINHSIDTLIVSMPVVVEHQMHTYVLSGWQRLT